MKKYLAKATAVGSVIASSFVLAAETVQAQVTNVTVGTGQGYATDLGNVINFALRAVMVVAILLVFAFLIIGGIEWITSGGDKTKTESARNKITSAVVGLIILAASYAILTVLLGVLGIDQSHGLSGVLNSVGVINKQCTNFLGIGC